MTKKVLRGIIFIGFIWLAYLVVLLWQMPEPLWAKVAITAATITFIATFCKLVIEE